MTHRCIKPACDKLGCVGCNCAVPEAVYEAIRAACRAEALEEAAQWQPIETAPDEVDFHALVASPIESGGLFVEEAWWCHERREWWPANTDHTDAHGCAVYPTHWMPLPQPPAIREMK